MSLASKKFDVLMARTFGSRFDDVDALAVGVSGGPDSMALLWLLRGWCAALGKVLHVLSVDHGLREEATHECAAVGQFCEQFDHVMHQVLVWDAPCDARVQEEARRARYDLMCDYCTAHDLKHLFLAHHAGDQAETVLFRLAKGSGFQGLSGMRAMQARDGVTLCRPLLGVEKQALIDVCDVENIPYLDDPSNQDDGFARVRLRQSMDVLAAEGLSEKRLAATATRIKNANDVIDFVVEKEIDSYTLKKDTNCIEFKIKICDVFFEILVRVVLWGIEQLGPVRDYSPRLEKVEALVYALKHDEVFRKRTLGGVIFERDDAAGKLILTREKSAD